MITILQGDALEKLRELPDESVQCCVTSPPYWGLRDYGTARWEGGDECCDHKPSDEWLSSQFTGETAAINGKESQRASGMNRWYEKDGSCKCGAKRIDAQIGLEETPDAYVAKIVEVFREVRRVLKNDGTLWLNLGDTYSSFRDVASGKQDYLNGTAVRCATPLGLKPKDLCGIPWRVAFALHADGWYLRSDIIWHKPNPMPESVTDWPTKSHEYLFLLSKRERYFYEADAIKENVGTIYTRQATPNEKLLACTKAGSAFCASSTSENNWFGSDITTDGRNRRSVWRVPTAPYSGAHFATFPPNLIKPCILAGTKSGDTVLDPFGGSGTTGAVAIELGRKALLIELNPAYISLIDQRCAITPGMPL